MRGGGAEALRHLPGRFRMMPSRPGKGNSETESGPVHSLRTALIRTALAYLKRNAVSSPSTFWMSRMPSATTGLARTALPPARARAASSPLSSFSQCT